MSRKLFPLDMMNETEKNPFVFFYLTTVYIC